MKHFLQKDTDYILVQEKGRMPSEDHFAIITYSNAIDASLAYTAYLSRSSWESDIIKLDQQRIPYSAIVVSVPEITVRVHTEVIYDKSLGVSVGKAKAQESYE